MSIKEILALAAKGKVSDIHIKVGLPPMFRFGGRLVPMKNMPLLSPQDVKEMVLEILEDRHRRVYDEHHEVDFSYGLSGVGRFRINVYQQRGTLAMAIRPIPMEIHTLEELNLPESLKHISEARRGLVLVTGTTSSGKSTTLAAMINHINETRNAHIITIEDPIEFLIRDKFCMISQRELGVDTYSFAHALRSSLRQDPDIIFIGELRDLETVRVALAAAETGHLVLSTLHTLDATETITRIISMFPSDEQKSVRLQLAGILKAVISQRLLSRQDNKGRVPAVEVLVSTKIVQDIIREPERMPEMHDVIAKSANAGMQSFDQSLMKLLAAQLISFEEAMRNASRPDDFALRVKGVVSESNDRWINFEPDDKDDYPL